MLFVVLEPALSSSLRLSSSPSASFIPLSLSLSSSVPSSHEAVLSSPAQYIKQGQTTVTSNSSAPPPSAPLEDSTPPVDRLMILRPACHAVYAIVLHVVMNHMFDTRRKLEVSEKSPLRTLEPFGEIFAFWRRIDEFDLLLISVR